LEDFSELREFPDFEGGVDEAAGEEVDGFLSVEAVADAGSLMVIIRMTVENASAETQAF